MAAGSSRLRSNKTELQIYPGRFCTGVITKPVWIPVVLNPPGCLKPPKKVDQVFLALTHPGFVISPVHNLPVNCLGSLQTPRRIHKRGDLGGWLTSRSLKTTLERNKKSKKGSRPPHLPPQSRPISTRTRPTFVRLVTGSTLVLSFSGSRHPNRLYLVAPV